MPGNGIPGLHPSRGEEAGHRWRYRYCHGSGFDPVPPHQITASRIQLDNRDHLFSSVAGSGQARYLPRVQTSDLLGDDLLAALENPAALYIAPLKTGTRVIGLIVVDSFEKDGISCLEGIPVDPVNACPGLIRGAS